MNACFYSFRSYLKVKQKRKEFIGTDMKTNRENDAIFGSATESFCCNKIFSHFSNASFERVTDKEEQIKGTDIIINMSNGQELKVDVKTFSVNYVLSTDITKFPTFAMELSFINRAGNLNIGWFLNKDLDTTHYLLLYPVVRKYKPIDGRKVDETNVNEDDIIKADAYLVSKARIMDYLKKSRGVTEELLWQYATEVREAKENRNYEENGRRAAQVRYSPFLAEKPVNILIRRNELDILSLAVFHYENGKCTQRVFDKSKYDELLRSVA